MAILVLTTVATTAQARKLSEAIIAGGYAACVSEVPRIKSMYRWKGKIVRSPEILLLIKTARKKWKSLQGFIRKHHPYELPECVALPVRSGLKEYLAWLENP